MTITTGSEVKAIAQFTNEYTDAEILTEIDIVEAELYDKFNLPKRASFSVDNDYTEFFLSKDKIYDIIRVQASVATNIDASGFLSIGSASNWNHNAGDNFIFLEPSTITTYDTKQMRIRYIPKAFNLLASNIVALNLIEPTTIVDGETSIQSPEVIRIRERIKRYKKLVRPRSIFRSSAETSFDPFDYPSVSQTDLR